MHNLSQAIDQCRRLVRRLDAPMCGRESQSRISAPGRSMAGERFFCHCKEQYVIYCNSLSPKLVDETTSCDGEDVW